ncbi:hypothetical protein NQ318_015099 [Aromia moschata]|uniref:N-acetylglucosamine-1-phosphotransferase subunits alpha/beta n=1 Tax=Aromia moschata TaxID=1265417 RepID=A0AAV8YZ61_9CUCU|nr:hypothetical protein NQ318_015099 [Aromia moschata]
MDTSKQRFDDKYELKFSLRSLEKYAPWVNHVYIVTNGQIPYWLNLDYEKVSIVTHDEIFRDTISLPSFSSPAIECNLHRIPGLSKRFIYFNDDIFLGQPTFLEDFYAPNRGFLIYLAWPVPQCALSCPWMYVADGQCDKDCFVPECQMDGGDCDDKSVTVELQTEDLEVNDEDDTQKQVLADTIQRVRAHFYRSFLKRLMPRTTTVSSTTSRKISRFLNLTDVRDLAKYVDDYNRNTLREEKRKRRRTRRIFHKRENRTFYSRLRPINVDAYSASLQHTNRMLNGRYGFKTRKVPSTCPCSSTGTLWGELQGAFAKEYAHTERNRVRKRDDVQFSFAVGDGGARGRGDLDEFDTDLSSTWSDREIRTLLTKLYELPLSYAVVDHFEAMLLNCSENWDLPVVSTPSYERYIDSKLPTITKDLVISCPSLSAILTQRFGQVPKYKYEIVHNSESKYVTFKMLSSNISDVVSNLDEIRSDTRKFVCLNDNLDETKAGENELVRAVLYDFYLSLFPRPSRFELPEDYRNKFGYVKDLEEWKTYRQNTKTFVCCLVFSLLCFTLYNVCKKKCCQIANKLFC